MRQRWTLVRHGETEGESSIRLNGATDVALNDIGRTQMVRAAQALRNGLYDITYTSPLKRARQSASIVAEPHVLSPEIIEEFRELNFGDWEGLTYEEIARRDPALLATRQSRARDFTYPGGDNRLTFERRVRGAARALRDGPPGLLLVLHKGVIKIVLSELLGLDFEEYRHLPVDLGSVHVVDVYPDFAKLITKNETTHLGDAHIKDISPPR